MNVTESVNSHRILNSSLSQLFFFCFEYSGKGLLRHELTDGWLVPFFAILCHERSGMFWIQFKSWWAWNRIITVSFHDDDGDGCCYSCDKWSLPSLLHPPPTLCHRRKSEWLHCDWFSYFCVLNHLVMYLVVISHIISFTLPTSSIFFLFQPSWVLVSKQKNSTHFSFLSGIKVEKSLRKEIYDQKKHDKNFSVCPHRSSSEKYDTKFQFRCFTHFISQFSPLLFFILLLLWNISRKLISSLETQGYEKHSSRNSSSFCRFNILSIYSKDLESHTQKGKWYCIDSIHQIYFKFYNFQIRGGRE